jgi:hypothetical protein
MLTGEIRSQVDAVWNAFWTGGISNPLKVIEQITYLLFLKRLDDLQKLEENRAARLKQPLEKRIFAKGKDKIGSGVADEEMRWSRFSQLGAPAKMMEIVADHAFPFMRGLVPPRREQDRFAAKADAVDTVMAAQRRSLAELDALFASLEHRAFRGEL